LIKEAMVCENYEIFDPWEEVPLGVVEKEKKVKKSFMHKTTKRSKTIIHKSEGFVRKYQIENSFISEVIKYEFFLKKVTY
jgi:hypothetical protein